MDGSGHSHDVLVYCLTRDHELADAVEERLSGALAFFYNDAARLHQAVVLRPPDLVLVDTAAIRTEYGDAGLGPVVAFLRERAPEPASRCDPYRARSGSSRPRQANGSTCSRLIGMAA